RPAGTKAAGASTLHATLPASEQTGAAPAPTAPPPGTHLSANVTLHLVATVPGAQVTLRGKNFPLPYHAEVPRGSVPEIVRITAPPYQGRQYWITLDQTRYLAIDLRPGTGVVEATPGETAIALGEAAPTEHVQPAVVYRTVTAPAQAAIPAAPTSLSAVPN